MKSDTFPVAFGVLVSTVLAGTLVIAGLKAGITPGVSPLVILCAWGAFASAATRAGGKRLPWPRWIHVRTTVLTALEDLELDDPAEARAVRVLVRAYREGLPADRAFEELARYWQE